MPNNQEDLSQKAAEIRQRSAEMLKSMTMQSENLRDVQKHMTPRQFKEWALTELGLDELTLRDMLTFDGTIEGISERMTRWLMNIISGGKTS